MLSKPVLSETTVMVPTVTYSLPIDPTNALSESLVSVVALSEGAGTTFYDSATGETYSAVALTGSPAAATPPAWFIPQQTPDYPWIGPAIQNYNAQAIQGGPASTTLIPANTQGYSYAALIQPIDTTTFGRIMDGTGAAVVTLYTNIPGPGLGKFSTTWRNSNGASINVYAPFILGKWALVLCTVQQGLGVIYVNGAEAASSTLVDITHSAANQSGQLVYNATGNGSGAPNANFSSFWVWNRVLSPPEVTSHYADPWQMLR